MIRQLSVVALVAACAAPAPAPAPEPRFQGELVPFSDGFQVTGTNGLLISFDRTFDSAIASMTKVRGAPVSVEVFANGCRAASWPDGLVAYFDPDFAGWTFAGQSAGRMC